jgi:hypothetical protein
MPLLSFLARLFILRRLFGGPESRRRRSQRGWSSGYGYGGRGRTRGGRRAGSGRVGLFGPFPYYSRRTARGSRVSVGGCCLPIPLALTVALAGAVRALSRR